MQSLGLSPSYTIILVSDPYSHSLSRLSDAYVNNMSSVQNNQDVLNETWLLCNCLYRPWEIPQMVKNIVSGQFPRFVVFAYNGNVLPCDTAQLIKDPTTRRLQSYILTADLS